MVAASAPSHVYAGCPPGSSKLSTDSCPLVGWRVHAHGVPLVGWKVSATPPTAGAKLGTPAYSHAAPVHLRTLAVPLDAAAW